MTPNTATACFVASVSERLPSATPWSIFQPARS